MVEIKDVIGWGVLIVCALLGGIVGSRIRIRKRKQVNNSYNNVKQNVGNGNGNVLAGGNVTITKNED